MKRHPTPWRIEDAPYIGWTRRRNGQRRQALLGRIVDANGDPVYAGPASFNALTLSGARQIISAVNKTERSRCEGHPRH